MTNTGSKFYRKDIQGLRAIAVILVILFHLDVVWFSGGFVGVDVFFVISGYLITGYLYAEYQKNGKIDLSDFYFRRLKRLFPVLIVVILSTVCIVYYLFPAENNVQLLSSLPFAVTWTSNLFFANGSKDYFNEFEENDLFLHTWSLGVEEQFYLVWPLLVILICSQRKISPRSAFIAVIAISFSLSVVLSYTSQIHSFYMMPSRVWQFGCGALTYYLASECGYASLKRKKQFSLAALSGLGLIVISATTFNNKMIYPAFLAIVPTLGTALVIYSGKYLDSGNLISKFISNRIFQWIGDRSYSLYLWHWPIIVIIGLLGFDIGTHPNALIFGLLLTVFLAMLSYEYIELPFWHAPIFTSSKRPFVLASCACVLFTYACGQYVTNIPTQSKSIDISAHRSDIPEIYYLSCDSWYHDAELKPCIFGNSASNKTVVLLGDSIGLQWFSAYLDVFSANQWQIIVLTKSSCPIVDEKIYYHRINSFYDVCDQWKDKVLSYIKNTKPDVIIAGSAATYDYSKEQWINGSSRLLKVFSTFSQQTIMMAGTPTLGFDGPTCIANGNECIGEEPIEKFELVLNYLEQAASKFDNVHVINSLTIVCPDKLCKAQTENGMVVFRDSQHLSDKFVRAKIDEVRTSLEDVILLN